MAVHFKTAAIKEFRLNNKSMTCPMCGKTFRNEHGFFYHLGCKHVFLYDCVPQFLHEALLGSRDDLRRRRTIESPAQQCPKCDWKQNTTRRHLQVHLICHYQEKIQNKFNIKVSRFSNTPTTCSLCSNEQIVYRRDWDLIVHMGIKHNGLNDCMIDDGFKGFEIK